MVDPKLAAEMFKDNKYKSAQVHNYNDDDYNDNDNDNVDYNNDNDDYNNDNDDNNNNRGQET